MDIDKSINKLYDKSGLMQKYGDQVWIAIITVFIFGIIFTYLHVLNHMQKVKKNWATERCNPFIMPIAGWINNTDKTNESDLEYTANNFEFCLGNIITNFFHYISDAFKSTISGLQDIFADIGIILAALINFFMSLITSLLLLIEYLWHLVLQGYVSAELGLNSVRDSLGKITGSVIVILYTQILSFRLSIMWMITTPIFMIFTLLIQQLIDLLLWCLKHQTMVLLQWTTFAFCLTGIDIAALGTSMSIFFSSLAAEMEATAAGMDTLGEGFLAQIPAEIAIPFVGWVMSTASLTAGIGKFLTGVGFVVSFIINGITALANAIMSGIGMAQTVASCFIAIGNAIYNIVMLLVIIASVTATMVILYIIYLCWQFVKVTLGQMNVPGQGIPGLSF